MGKTGFSDDIHLHFGLYKIIGGKETAIDPAPYLEGRLLLTGFNCYNPCEPVIPENALNPFCIKRDDKVRINAGAKDHYGNNIEQSEYSKVYKVLLIEDNGRTLVGTDDFSIVVSALYLTLIN